MRIIQLRIQATPCRVARVGGGVPIHEFELQRGKVATCCLSWSLCQQMPRPAMAWRLKGVREAEVGGPTQRVIPVPQVQTCGHRGGTPGLALPCLGLVAVWYCTSPSLATSHQVLPERLLSARTCLAQVSWLGASVPCRSARGGAGYRAQQSGFPLTTQVTAGAINQGTR